ncbi:MAG: hypothetical protein ACRD4R_08995 [Candidatus Acidiferrales bacterium]
MAEQDEVGWPAEAAVERLEAAPAGGAVQGEFALNYCPRCSARLSSRSCKLICPSCGYYMSCSDFY